MKAYVTKNISGWALSILNMVAERDLRASSIFEARYLACAALQLRSQGLRLSIGIDRVIATAVVGPGKV
jgi:hypothetical protein